MSFLFQWYEEIAMKIQTHNDTSAMVAGRLGGGGGVSVKKPKSSAIIGTVINDLNNSFAF